MMSQSISFWKLSTQGFGYGIAKVFIYCIIYERNALSKLKIIQKLIWNVNILPADWDKLGCIYLNPVAKMQTKIFSTSETRFS